MYFNSVSFSFVDFPKMCLQSTVATTEPDNSHCVHTPESDQDMEDAECDTSNHDNMHRSAAPSMCLTSSLHTTGKTRIYTSNTPSLECRVDDRITEFFKIVI